MVLSYMTGVPSSKHYNVAMYDRFKAHHKFTMRGMILDTSSVRVCSFKTLGVFPSSDMNDEREAIRSVERSALEIVNDDFPLINDELIYNLVTMIRRTNNRTTDIVDDVGLMAFLAEHRGKPAFCLGE